MVFVCNRCGEPLKYERGRGWVHRDGKLIKTKMEYSEILGKVVEKDDHCALPVPEHEWSGRP